MTEKLLTGTLSLNTNKISFNVAHNISCLMTKPTKWHVCPAKTQISLGIRPIWSESSLSVWRKLGSSSTHWAHSKDWSDWADAQADLSLHWAHSHFVGYVMRWLSFYYNLQLPVKRHSGNKMLKQIYIWSFNTNLSCIRLTHLQMLIRLLNFIQVQNKKFLQKIRPKSVAISFSSRNSKKILFA